MSGISTHVLDTSLGRPATGINVSLEKQSGAAWQPAGRGTTSSDGRIAALLPSDTALAEGTYRMTFETATYFRARGAESFYPHVSVVFEVRDAKQHYHVPLLLSPYGYSTYRGS